MARFSLASVERDASEPFEVEGSDGTVYELPHPKSLHYDDLMQLDLNNPARSLEILLGDKADALVSDPKLDGWALEQLFTRWAEHYGIPVNLGEGAASPRSSSGTARPSRRTSRSSSTTRKR